MSNMALKPRSSAAASACCARRGRRYVLAEMQEHNAALGGEPVRPISSRTWRPPATACSRRSWCSIRSPHRQSLDELTADLKVFPQVIVNVQVHEKKPLEAIPTVPRHPRREEELKDTGRVVIRFSGTERWPAS